MGSFCGAKPATREIKEASKRAVDVGKVQRRTGLDAVVSDIAMDLGLRERDTEYFSRLDERAARSKAAMEQMQQSNRDDRRTAVTSTPEPEAPTEPETPTAPTPPTTPTPPPSPPDIGTDTVVDTGVDTTYRGGNVDVGDVVDNRVVTSETEAEAIESTGRGRRSTIATSPKGLLGTGGATRPRRSLVGGGLIR